MADPSSEPAAPERCPWCSAPLPDPTAETCPSCGATLASTTPGEQLPGVTTLDTEAILRARSSAGRPRSRLLSFITGDTEDAPSGPMSPESLAPPSEAVRREMLRMEIAAEVADLEAEVQSLETEIRIAEGQPLVPTEAAVPPDDDPAAGEPDAGAVPPAAAPASPAPPETAAPADASESLERT